MIQAEGLAYIHMQKTGGSHITKLLIKTLNGKRVGEMHLPASKEIIETSEYIVSSIRNPWDWYLSLWTFGVSGRGALRRRLNKGNWHSLYDHAGSVQSFRNWLNFIHDPNSGRWLGEGYGRTMLPTFTGFMTYRHLYLCCRNFKRYANSGKFTCYEDLEKFDRSNCYIDYFVRQESLESDICKVIQKIKPLSEENRRIIYSQEKTKTSERVLSISDYYDEETIALVGRRDKLLIDKFGYSPPVLT